MEEKTPINRNGPRTGSRQEPLSDRPANEAPDGPVHNQPNDHAHDQRQEHDHGERHTHHHGPSGHFHSHDHEVPDQLTRSFVLGIVLNVIMVAAGVGVGLWSHSLALLSDAGHNLSDVASLLLSLWGLKLSKTKSSARYTYGYKKATVITSLINAVVLIAVTGWIAVEALIRLRTHTPEIPGLLVSSMAFFGILINSFSAYLFIKQKDADLNVEGAYYHMASDAVISFSVLVAGLLIFLTHWYWLDPAMSLVISGLVLWGCWGLLIKSLRLSLDGVPQGVEIQSIQSTLDAIPGVSSAHHLHVWALSTNEFALTAHLVVSSGSTLAEADRLKNQVRSALLKFKIQHVTLEIESTDEKCDHENCSTHPPPL